MSSKLPPPLTTEPVGVPDRIQDMAPKSVIAGVRGELPTHRYTQAEITDAFLEQPDF